MIRRNIIANLLGRAWAFLAVLIFTPLYVRALGIEAYGLVGFYSTLLTVLAFADMGFTATLNRELARLSVNEGSGRRMSDMLRTYEAAYVGISFCLALLIWAAAPFISARWLQSQRLAAEQIQSAIRLMGLAIALQLPSGLYIGGLQGLQHQVRANALQICWGVLLGVGTLLALHLISATIVTFAAAQLAANAVYCLASRFSLWRIVNVRALHAMPKLRFDVVRETWAYAAGMVGMTAVSTVLTQSDKLVISRLLPLTSLGYYTLATAFAAAPIMLVSPVASAVFPRLTACVAGANGEELLRVYRKATALASVAIIPGTLTLAFFASDFLRAWTGSQSSADGAANAARLLLLGQGLQAMTMIPFYLALANGDVKLNLRVGLASIALFVPLLIVGIRNYGIEGAAGAWLIMNACVVPLYVTRLHSRFLASDTTYWWHQAAVRPLLVAFPFALAGRMIFPPSASRFATLATIGFVWMVTAVATSLALTDLRDAMRPFWVRFAPSS